MPHEDHSMFECDAKLLMQLLLVQDAQSPCEAALSSLRDCVVCCSFELWLDAAFDCVDCGGCL